ncbi:MAG: methyltransferase [Spirochaetes bacterium]|jgi:O-methyltransferase|nr:methyltransferase [Spirochaetota bacterium]
MSAEKRYPPGYGPVQPQANYRPWDIDGIFAPLYTAVQEHTKVDEARCYLLWQAALQCGSVKGDFLEVGVWRGGTGALLCDAAARLADERHVYLADTFRGVVKAGPRDDYYKGGEHADTDRETVEGLLAELDTGNYTILEGVFPEETGDRLPNGAIALCHVDVDVYQSARDVTEWVWPRMPVGGLVVYDDYGFYGCEGVTALGNEDFERTDRLFLHNLSGQAFLIKLQP